MAWNWIQERLTQVGKSLQDGAARLLGNGPLSDAEGVERWIARMERTHRVRPLRVRRESDPRYISRVKSR